MAWPTPQDYNEAVQSPQSSFTDPDLRVGRVEEDKLGLPRPISGRFAVVYNMRCGPRSFAVRCFQSEVPDQQERYAAISEHLKKARLPYTVGFEFLKEGIRVRGQWYPVLKMEWITGQPLHTYIESRLKDATALVRLATDWLTMTEALQKASLAHGDLQDGNVLVAGGQLKLIDYDGMFVPALAGRTSNEGGHRNYQHPNRTALDYGLFLDNFSNWVIYVSIVALAIDPTLWTRLKGGDECLLFRKEDFIPNSRSQVLSSLLQHPDPRLSALASIFESLLYLMPQQVPALTTNVTVDPASLRQQAATSVSNSDGASWLNDHVKLSSQTGKEAMPAAPASQTSTAPLPTASPTWILDLITPVTTRRSFDQPLFGLRLTLAILLLLIFILPVFGNVTANIIGESFLVAFLSTLPFLAYRRESVVQERLACLSQEREQQAALKGLQQRIREQEHMVARLHAEEKKAKAALEQEREATRQNEQRAHQRASAELKSKMEALTTRQQSIDRPLLKLRTEHQAGVARSNQQIANCNQQQVQEFSTALQPLQRQFIQDFMRSARIDTARISGIGPKMVGNLRTAGYSTAADVTWGVQNVGGIGNSKASALMGWRQAVETEARRKMPTTLSKAQEYAIIAKYDSQRQGLQQQAMAAKVRFEAQERALQQQSAAMISAVNAERATAQQQFGQQNQKITAQYQVDYEKLSQREAVLTTDFSKKVAEVERQTGDVRKSIYDQNWQVAKARQALEVYQNVTFTAYLSTVLRVHRNNASSSKTVP